MLYPSRLTQDVYFMDPSVQIQIWPLPSESSQVPGGQRMQTGPTVGTQCPSGEVWRSGLDSYCGSPEQIWPVSHPVQLPNTHFHTGHRPLPGSLLE